MFVLVAGIPTITLNSFETIYRMNYCHIMRQSNRRKDSNHQNHPRLLRVTLKNASDVEDVLLASHLLKSDGNVRILPDIPYTERNRTRNIPKEYREAFFR